MNESKVKEQEEVVEELKSRVAQKRIKIVMRGPYGGATETNLNT